MKLKYIDPTTKEEIVPTWWLTSFDPIGEFLDQEIYLPWADETTIREMFGFPPDEFPESFWFGCLQVEPEHLPVFEEHKMKLDLDRFAFYVEISSAPPPAVVLEMSQI